MSKTITNPFIKKFVDGVLDGAQIGDEVEIRWNFPAFANSREMSFTGTITDITDWIRVEKGNAYASVPCQRLTHCGKISG